MLLAVVVCCCVHLDVVSDVDVVVAVAVVADVCCC